jgi:hypothetical protein
MRLPLVAVAIVSALAIAYCPAPWSAVLLSAAALLVAYAVTAKRTAAKVALANIGAVCFALALFEAYLAHEELRGDGTRLEGSITEGFTHLDDVLGYAPDASARVTARKLHGDTLVYDVVYTIGPDGLRIAPPASDATLHGCVVFFGDSVTFGEGVNDDQTLPYQVGIKTDGRYKVYNFAFSGYGPHQMLAGLRAKWVERIAACKPTHFINLIILAHVARVAGLTGWDRHGPRFRLDRDGMPVQDGHFDTPATLLGHWTPPSWVVYALDRCYTWQQFFGRTRNPNEADLALLIGVVQEAERFTRARYPDSEFHVILWDVGEDPRERRIATALAKAKIPVHLLSSAIPDFAADWKQYVLSPYDLHPNPLLHERLAEYVVRRVLVSNVPSKDVGDQRP